MASDILARLKREESELQAEVQKAMEDVPAYRKLVALRPLIALYQDAPEGFIGSVQPDEAYRIRAVGEHRRGRPGSKKEQVETVISTFLQERGTRAQSGEMMEIVERAGIELGGDVPSRSLASFLSTSPLFNNVRGEGYGLAEWGTSPGPKAQTKEASATPPADASKLGSIEGAMSFFDPKT